MLYTPSKSFTFVFPTRTSNVFLFFLLLRTSKFSEKGLFFCSNPSFFPVINDTLAIDHPTVVVAPSVSSFFQFPVTFTILRQQIHRLLEFQTKIWRSRGGDSVLTYTNSRSGQNPQSSLFRRTGTDFTGDSLFKPEMKFMELGFRPDTFYTVEAVRWTQELNPLSLSNFWIFLLTCSDRSLIFFF